MTIKSQKCMLNVKSNKIRLKNVIIKPKPWGREIWFAWTDKYAGKILEIKRGHRFSLQYHEKKCETQFVLKGKIIFTCGKNPKRLKQIKVGEGEKIEIEPGLIHRAQALEKTVIFEVSTPELDDVVKLADDYGRTGRDNNEKLDMKLAKAARKNEFFAKHRKISRGLQSHQIKQS